MSSRPHTHRHTLKSSPRQLQRAKRLARLGLLLGMLLNWGYGFFRLFFGVATHSFWMCGEASYYALLGSIRFLLAREDARSHTVPLWQGYRQGGILLLFLALAMGGIIALALGERPNPAFGGITVIGALLFALWRIGSAVLYMLRVRTQHSPSLLCAKTLSLAGALLSLFGLQGTLLAPWQGSPLARILASATSGGAVFLLLSATGLWMLCTSFRQKRP